MTSLDSYLDQTLRLPWQWGRMDCTFFGGDWIAARAGLDPLAPYRGLYRTAGQAVRLIKQRGGLLAMVSLEMTRCGFERVEEPEHGDIAVMELPELSGKMAVANASVVIRHGSFWVARGLDCIAGIDRPVQAIWRIPA